MKEIKIYWDDLKPEVQNELLEILDGDNRNWDVFPMFTIDIEDENEEEG